MNSRMTLSNRNRSLPDTRWTGALALAAMLFMLIGCFTMVARSDVSESEQSAAVGQSMLDLFEARADLAWVHYDLLVDGLLAEYRGVEIGDGRLDEFHRIRNESLGELDTIAAGNGRPAELASELLGFYYDEPFQSWPYPLFELDDQHYLSVSPDVAGWALAELPSHDDDLLNSMLPLLVLNDALAIELLDRDRQPTEWALEHVEYMVSVLESGPGWLGPERSNPLHDNLMASQAFGPAPTLAGHDRLSLPDLQVIWDYDQWIIGRFEDGVTDDSPMTLEQLNSAVRSSTEDLRRITLENLDEAGAVFDQASSPSREPLLLIVSLICLGLALVALGLLSLQLVRRHSALAELALTDGLTGAKNHRFLDQEVAERCAMDGRHHVIAMIDLDRFKMVNDTFGHDAGDALLVATVDRLERAVAELTEPLDGATAAVIRPGGDEFIVAIHLPRAGDVDAIATRLRQATGPVDVGLEQLVDLQFSVGIADSTTPVDHSDLLKSADLAVYQDKSRRSAERWPMPVELDLSQASGEPFRRH